MRYASPITLLVLLTLAFGTRTSLFADQLVTTDTTQNGGVLVVNPVDTLVISDPTNNPLFTLTNGAGTSGILAVIVGRQSNDEGRLLVEAGSYLLNNGKNTLGSNAGSTGTATIDAALWWNSDGSLTIGNYGTGFLTVQNGGLAVDANADLGYYSGSDGTSTVTGTDSKWQISNGLVVGRTGTGTLNIEDGGLVTNGSSTLGNNVGGTGTATVTGAGSKWANSGMLTVGASGTGTLSVEDGGLVTSNTGELGSKTGSNGTATVTGLGSSWQNVSLLTVGNAGTGKLTVEDGGFLTSGYSMLGSNLGDGTVTITGAGSEWQNAGLLAVGGTGSGTLTVADKGKVTTNTLYASLDSLLGDGTISTNSVILDANLEFKNNSQLQQTLNFGSGGQLTFDITSGNETLGVGYKGTGDLSISEGMVVKTYEGFLGYQANSKGTATVSGAGSRWQNKVDTNVGFHGEGALTIKDGAIVTNDDGWVGQLAGSKGTVTVTGAGSRWDNVGIVNMAANGGSGELIVERGGVVTSRRGNVGYDANSTAHASVIGQGSKWLINSELLLFGNNQTSLNIEDGGLITSSHGLISAGTATITGAGSEWQIVNILQLRSTATVNIENGGVVKDLYSVVGYSSGSDSTVNVMGAGSKWQNTGSITLGDYNATGTLNIKDGGLVTSEYGAVGSNFSHSIGAVNVTGNGSKWQSIGLNLGYKGKGSMTIEDGGVVSTNSAALAYEIGSSASATVTGPGSLWESSLSMIIGQGGTATLKIEEGGVVKGGYVWIGSHISTSSNATVSGVGSKWESTEEFDIARMGKANLTIEDGGLVVSKDTNVGFQGGGIGKVTITGEGSKWQNSNVLYIGDGYGNGTVNIENGGLLVSKNSYIGSDTYDVVSAAVGKVSVTGEGSIWRNSGALIVGDTYSTGSLIVQNGGVVEAEETIVVRMRGTLGGDGGTIVGNVLNQGLIAPGNSPGVVTIDGDLTSTGNVQFELAGIGTGLFDQLIVTGELNLGGVVELDLIDGFNPTAGSSFKLLSFGSLIDSGFTFDLTHATLGANLSWDTSTFESNGTIRVVPEASSLMLAGMVTFAGLFVWRKNGR